MFSPARKLLIFFALFGGSLSGVLPAGRSAPVPAAPLAAPAVETCGPPPPVVTRPSRPEEEGCRETPSPALAHR